MHSRTDFSSNLKTTPTLKGVVNNCPLGNSKGDFSKIFKFKKSFLGCY